MGVTGSGETTFTNLITNARLKVGHGLGSCTTEIQLAGLKLDGKDVVLIDTPGFDDTDRSQGDVLNQIATFLKQTSVVLQILLPPCSYQQIRGWKASFRRHIPAPHIRYSYEWQRYRELPIVQGDLWR